MVTVRNESVFRDDVSASFPANSVLGCVRVLALGFAGEKKSISVIRWRVYIDVPRVLKRIVTVNLVLEVVLQCR